MSLSQDECQQKLEKLKLWQEKQKKLLYDKQMEEKRLLCDTQMSNNDSFINKSISSINCDTINNENKGITESKTIVKKAYLKRGEGLKNRFGIDPNKFRLTNLPRYKFSKKTDNNSNKLNLNQIGDDRLDKIEEETNDNNISSTNSNHRPQISLLEYNQNRKIETKERIVEQKTNNEVRTWASVLDPALKIPISIAQFKGPNISNVSQNEKDQLNLFELLEQKVDDSRYSFNSTDIFELLNNKNLFPESENRVITNEPLINSKEILEKKLQATLVPSPSEVDDLKSNGDDCDTESCDSSFHVRFSDKVTVNEINSDSDTDFENEESSLKPLKTSITSTPNEKHYSYPEPEKYADENFEELIQQILGVKQKEIQEKSQLLDFRLKELEHEIALFQQQNQILTKMKQEHELEKIDMEKRFHQSNKALEDEKIRIEIYLNDEKLKLKEEKTKIEKKLAQPNKRDREEIFRLQDQIIELKEEIKSKETKHSSSQSRLRAQIRNLEKSLREKELEIENFKKENKKLEFENSRLRRQATSKMLNEINKNITKLAIANQSPLSTSNSKNDDDDKNKKSPSKQIKSKMKTVKAKSVTVLSSSSSSSVSAKSLSSSSDCDDECETPSIDPNSNISDTAREIGKSTQSEISDTLKSLKREISNPDGSKDIWYPNGNIKKISADGLNIKMLYYNKDIKETNINEGIVRYYYAETNTWHTQYLDGLEILEFPNGQTEHRHKDGKVAVHFENGSIKIKDPNDPEIAEEWRYVDGTVAKIKINGEKNILLPNGQKEIHTADHKRREYPDGTIKIVYPDGSQETRYSNGRVRLKDKEGKLIMDSVS